MPYFITTMRNIKHNIIIGAAFLAIGLIIGVLCSRRYFRSREPIVQNDTIVVHDTLCYSRLDLKDKTYQLAMPKVGKPEMVFIPEYSTNIIYRDSIRYVTLPRQYFYTNMNNVEIWHSGIDSTIDSLNVIHKTEVITKTIMPAAKHHSLGVGIEASCFVSPIVMPYGEYAYYPKPWISIYGRVYYDLPAHLWGVGLGVRMQVSW